MSETIAERQARARALEEREESLLRVERTREAIHGAKNQLFRATRIARSCDAARERVGERHPDAAGHDLRTSTTVLALTIPLAAVFIDSLLNGGTIDFLVKLAFPTAPQFVLYLLRYLTLIFIVITELEFGLAIAHALDEGRRGRRRASVIAMMASVLVLGMAGLTYVLTAAAHTGAHTAYLAFITPIFTVVVHAFTVMTGDRLRIGAAWFLFRAEAGVLVCLAWIYEQRADRNRNAVGTYARALDATVAEHNRRFPDATMTFGPVDREVETVLRQDFPRDAERWLGPMVSPPDEPPKGGSSPPTAAPTPEPPPPEPPPGSRDGTNEDFARLLREEEARRADSEVDPI